MGYMFFEAENFKKETERILTGKTIKEIEITGFGICLKTTDGLILDYDSSDGGWSCWGIKTEDEKEDKP